MISPILDPAARPRVLHTVEVFLPVTQNWIYPQITQVPGVDGAVLCRYARNPLDFPIDASRLFSRTPGGAVAHSTLGR
ncbi:MAG: hypothetical protein AAB425_08320, partial [Bdellovibrionota bacterium]